MGLYRITAKRSGSWSDNVKIEKGMSVEIVDNNNPLSYSKGQDKFRESFKSKYGVDLKQFATNSYFDSEKIN